MKDNLIRGIYGIYKLYNTHVEVQVKVTQLYLTAAPWTIQPMEFSRPEHWSGQPFPSPWDLSNPGVEPWFPALQTDSLPPEPQGKPKNTGVGSLSLLQGIFPTQESNRGVLHCRWILYQLSQKESQKNTGVGCHALLQGIFPTQGLNPGLLHCIQTLYPLSHQGSFRPLLISKINQLLWRRNMSDSVFCYLTAFGKSLVLFPCCTRVQIRV